MRVRTITGNTAPRTWVVAVGLAFATPVCALLEVSGNADSWTGTTLLEDSFSLSSPTAPSLYGSIPLDFSGGQAGASVQYGSARVGAIGSLFSDVLNQQLEVLGGLGSASARMLDTLTITPDPGVTLPEATGTIVIPIEATGFAEAVIASADPDDGPDITYGSVFASYNVSVRSHVTTTRGSGANAQGAPNDPAPPIDVIGSVVLEAPFTFGTPFEIELNATAAADGYAQSHGGVVKLHGSLENTIRFMGVTEIRDAEGRPIPFGDLSITSGSGRDYTMAAALPEPLTIQPVPVPGSALLALGPLALAVTRRVARGA